MAFCRIQLLHLGMKATGKLRQNRTFTASGAKEEKPHICLISIIFQLHNMYLLQPQMLSSSSRKLNWIWFNHTLISVVVVLPNQLQKAGGTTANDHPPSILVCKYHTVRARKPFTWFLAKETSPMIQLFCSTSFLLPWSTNSQVTAFLIGPHVSASYGLASDASPNSTI